MRECIVRLSRCGVRASGGGRGGAWNCWLISVVFVECSTQDSACACVCVCDTIQHIKYLHALRGIVHQTARCVLSIAAPSTILPCRQACVLQFVQNYKYSALFKNYMLRIEIVHTKKVVNTQVATQNVVIKFPGK